MRPAMFFRSKTPQNKILNVEPTSSSTSLAEMSELLMQAARVVEGIKDRCDTAEREREAAYATLALLKANAARLEELLQEKDQLLAAALGSAAHSRKELEASRLESSEFEVIAFERIDMLQAELEDLEKTATHRWGSLELRTSSEPGPDEAILDLIHFPDGAPLMERRAA